MIKKCCQTDEKPSKARKIYNGIANLMIALLFFGLIVSIFINQFL